MKVYRVEFPIADMKIGEGPFQSGTLGGSNKLPTPHRDKLIIQSPYLPLDPVQKVKMMWPMEWEWGFRQGIDYDWYCGTLTPEKLLEWFGKNADELKKAGYVVRIYEVDEAWINIFEHQVTFHHDAATPIDMWDIDRLTMN